ncbi:MAG: PAS domain-containing protein [Halobacteriaceae archaeon]
MKPTIGVLYVHATGEAGPLLDRLSTADDRLTFHQGGSRPAVDGVGIDCVLLDAPDGTHVPRGVEAARAAYGDVPVVVRTAAGVDAPRGEATTLIEVDADGPLDRLVAGIVIAAGDGMVPDEVVLRDEVLDSVPMGVTIADANRPDLPVVYANRYFESVTGYSRGDTLGRNCRFLQGPETAEEPVAEMRAAIADEAPVAVELKNYRADGTPFWNRVQLIPVTDSDGEVTHYLGFQRDVTEQTEKARRDERVRTQRSALVALQAETDGGDGTIRAALTAGREGLAVAGGHLARVDEAGEREMVTRVGDRIGPRGGEGETSGRSCCAETASGSNVNALADVTSTAQTEPTETGSYIGAPVVVEGERYGAVCFGDPAPRELEFTESERALVGLVASIVGRAIEQLERSERRSAVQ